MKKFDGIMICTDLDGTLLSDKRTISQDNIDAIEYFKANGGKFTFITGRVPLILKEFYDTIQPNCPFGCINGGGIFDHREMKYLWMASLPKSVFEMIEYVDTKCPDVGIMLNTADSIYFCKNNQAMQDFRDKTGVANITCDYSSLDEPIVKFMFSHVDSNKLDELQVLLIQHPKYGEFDYIRSEKTHYEILPKGVSKGAVMQKIAQMIGISPDKTVAVGDYDNDISMIKAAKLGIAVSNATAATKAVADHITVSNNENAIAKIIYDIENGVLKI